MQKRKDITFPAVAPICLTAILHKDTSALSRKTAESHIHGACEIYVHFSGDVSFMVENKVYPISRGDVIITRPFEYHHCIYSTPSAHDHMWITFSPKGNEALLAPFFDRKAGEGNLISLPVHKKEKLLALCESLVEETSDLNRYITFLSMLSLLSENGAATATVDLPEDVRSCVEYIARNVSEPITVKDLAAYAYVTETTLARHFKMYTGLTPYAYLLNYRLALAAAMLERGDSVTEAAAGSGFTDYSHFIALFKSTYGKTPLQYKKGFSAH